MPDTFTATLNLTKVEINGSQDTWGAKLNSNADKVDTFATTTGAALTSLDARLDVVEPLLAAGAGFTVPQGGIIMWSGSIANIPAGWALCNGANGTPNLRDRFIVGAGGSYNPYTTGGAASATTNTAGWHGHGSFTGGHTLTEAQMPAHSHGVNDPGHNHMVFTDDNTGAAAGGANRDATPGSFPQGPTSTTTTGVSVQSTGGGQAHMHPINSDGAHQHTVDTLPPFFALAFIMKL
jgi:hypothetical protein